MAFETNAVRTFAEVGAILGLSRGRVQKIEKAALAKLRERLILEPEEDGPRVNELFRDLSPSVERLEFIRSNRTSTD